MQKLPLDPMVDDCAPIAYIDQECLPHTVQDIIDKCRFERCALLGSPGNTSIYENDIFLDPTRFLAETFGSTQLRLLAAGIHNSLSRIFQLRNTQLYLALQYLPVNR